VIFPNPTKGKITVESEGSKNFLIYDSNGILILSESVSGIQEVDLEKLKSGIYFYNLGSKKGKLVIE
jgi:hypothetical protein